MHFQELPMESPYLALFFLSIANLLSTQPKGTDSSKALVSKYVVRRDRRQIMMLNKINAVIFCDYNLPRYFQVYTRYVSTLDKYFYLFFGKGRSKGRLSICIYVIGSRERIQGCFCFRHINTLGISSQTIRIDDYYYLSL